MKQTRQIKQPNPILFTKAGLNTLIEEEKKLLLERPHDVEELSKARAMGDLSENGYYKSARFKLSQTDRRLRELKHIIRYAKVRESSQTEVIEIGNTVTLDDGKEKRTFTIVGGYESNPSEGKLSHLSPLGKASIGKRVGESVFFQSPNGEKTYKVISIS